MDLDSPRATLLHRPPLASQTVPSLARRLYHYYICTIQQLLQVWYSPYAPSPSSTFSRAIVDLDAPLPLLLCLCSIVDATCHDLFFVTWAVHALFTRLVARATRLAFTVYLHQCITPLANKPSSFTPVVTKPSFFQRPRHQTWQGGAMCKVVFINRHPGQEQPWNDPNHASGSPAWPTCAYHGMAAFVVQTLLFAPPTLQPRISRRLRHWSRARCRDPSQSSCER